MSIPLKKDVLTLSPWELFEHSIKQYTPLMTCLFGLATGRSRPDLDKINDHDNPSHQLQYLAIYAACDIIIRCTTRYPMPFHLMLGDQLEIQLVSTVFRELLSAFRIAPSRLHSDKTQCEKVVVGLLKGVDVDTYDICLLNGDNIGFKILLFCMIGWLQMRHCLLN